MKTIKLRSLRHGNVHLNVNMIEAVYDHNGLTHVSTSKLIWEVNESVDDVYNLMHDAPLQDGMKKHFGQSASVSKDIDNLTKL